MRKKAQLIAASILLLFAVVTLFMSSSVLFDLFSIRERKGNFVPFVVWANFFAGLFYIAAVYGLTAQKRWTVQVLGTSLVLLVVTFLFFLLHIQVGGRYETQTIGALIFRIGITGFFTFIAWKINHPKTRSDS